MSLSGRLVLFDLDGTLVDSSPGIHAAVRYAAAALGRPEPTAAQLRGMVGPPLQDGFALVLGVPVADVPRAVAAYREHYAAGALLEATVHRGVPELLAALRAAGATLAVATSKPEPFAVRLLEHTGLLPAFASVHGATMDGPCGTRTRWWPPLSPLIRTAATRSSSATGRTTCWAPPRTGCRASGPAGDRRRTASWRPPVRWRSRPPRWTCFRFWSGRVEPVGRGASDRA